MPAVRPMPVFDTHKAVKALCHAGFDDAQAEAVVEQISDAVNDNVATKTDLDRFATKEDLERFATKDDLELWGAKFATKEDLAKQNATMLRYALGIVALAVALTKVFDAIIG